ncbi:MAG: hypothetical protein E7Z74_07830 [Methanobrevibacter millerae]|uniref:Adhesin-like protein n=1 Tax=Methanobrevibacter millerae TaxID=230361 RepID=A0A8T3VU69_9EURY|nr:hypothetical protein [Methanobrevibacter millerae]
MIVQFPTIEVKSVLAATDLTKSVSESKAFGATLVDGQGKLLANETVTFNINGMIYDRTTDSEGVARLNINCKKENTL